MVQFFQEMPEDLQNFSLADYFGTPAYWRFQSGQLYLLGKAGPGRLLTWSSIPCWKSNRRHLTEFWWWMLSIHTSDTWWVTWLARSLCQSSSSLRSWPCTSALPWNVIQSSWNAIVAEPFAKCITTIKGLIFWAWCRWRCWLRTPRAWWWLWFTTKHGFQNHYEKFNLSWTIQQHYQVSSTWNWSSW